MADKVPPPPPAVTVKANPTQSGANSILSAFKNLKKAETKVSDIGLKVVNVLILSKNWTAYTWLSPEIKKVLLTSKEADKERRELGSRNAQTAYAHVEVVDDYENGIVEWKALELHKKFFFTHVIVLSENDLIRGARIRSMIGLTNGQSVDNALRYRDKVIMKQVVRDTNKSLKVPTFSPVESASDVISFVKKYDYPVVVKPKLGYSSVNTTVLRNEDDLVEFVTHGLSAKGIDPIYGLQVEKFVNGPMFHIDGFVFDGKIIFSWPSKYIGTVMKFKENRYIAGYSLHPSNPLVSRLNTYIANVIESLGSDPHPNPRHFPFHAEAWHTPEDDIILCEIASRGGGGNIKKEIQELFEVNMDEIWIQSQCRDAFPLTFDDDLEKYEKFDKPYEHFLPKKDYLVGWTYIYPKVGTVQSFPEKDSDGKIPSLPDYCIHWQSFLEKGQHFNGPNDCADTVVAALVKGKDEDEVIKRIDELCDWFFANSVWLCDDTKL
eukprot:TRINITY_DN6644_c0_g1_i1.p1 TRINITY_DN6644_c0_g1~~TRINITY_DN6644_c0_g1_i1.p1  ORF type:complete len:492 (+),score=104.84 TRINITY_DN6644_c0_g1_i1:10-1485(+)